MTIEEFTKEVEKLAKELDMRQFAGLDIRISMGVVGRSPYVRTVSIDMER